MRLNLLVSFIASLLFFLLVNTVLAQDPPVAPVQIKLTVDQTTLEVGQSNRAILTVRNTTPYTLTNLSAQFQGTTFMLNDSSDLPDILPAHRSVQAAYTLESHTVGSHNAIFAVQYSWNDPNTSVTHHWIEPVSLEGIEVTEAPSWFNFNWPDYLTPLMVGWIFASFSSWLTNWYKQREEDQQRQEQARGVTLAILHAARKGVEEKEQVSFSLWEEAIVKGHLYPALHQLGRTIGKPELSQRLAELSIALHDYNKRQADHNLSRELPNKLVNELTELIQLLER